MLSWLGKSIPTRVTWLLHCTGMHYADMAFFFAFVRIILILVFMLVLLMYVISTYTVVKYI